ncbi:unnamed protein product [Closterium sp. NIES-65]|nr:unnamed protein product [Closterium sp. NIES-65]
MPALCLRTSGDGAAANQAPFLTFERPRGGCASSTSGGNSRGGDGDGSMVVNLWEEEDASLHLAHISRHCTNLRSLSLGHVSLSAPTLLSTLKPMPALQHLSLSWLHASPAALQAVLEATPNLRQLTIFMASGFPHLELRLPSSLQHLSLSYIRADSVTLYSACSLQFVSHRDMFLGALSIRDAPNLRQLSVASANSLLVSAPHSSRLESIDLRAGSLNWPATETLISSNSAALESLSLDFFATSSSGLPSVSFSQPVGYCFALTAAERQHQLFLKGLDCLQRRFGCFYVTSPLLQRRKTY